MLLVLLLCALASISSINVAASSYNVCPSTGLGWQKWSSYFVNQNLTNTVVVISGVNILMDVSPPIIYNLTIQNGGLYFDPSFSPTPSNPILTLSANNIFVNSGGYLVVGCVSVPWTQPASVVLYGASSMYTQSILNVTPGRKVVAVANGGTLQVYATMNGPTWTKLGVTAMPSNNTITLVDQVAWKAGQEIVIASSEEDPNQSEKRTIVSISGGTVITLDAPLKNRHWGELWTDSTYGDKIDIRAEVGLLTRLVKFTSDATNSSDNGLFGSRFGGHVMILTGATGQVFGAEFTLMGQAGFVARYPYHFHMMADTGAGSLAQKLSIHDNFQRSLTVHYSNYVQVSDCVAYQTYGHMFFLEDAVELNNVFTHNLGINAYAPRGFDRLMISDATPAIFWITSPYNTWINNSAVGGDTSYWFALPTAALGVAKYFNVIAYPQQTSIIAFTGNTGHSANNGVFIDKGPNVNPPCTPDQGFTGNNDTRCGAGPGIMWQPRELYIPTNTTASQASLLFNNAPSAFPVFKNNTFWKMTMLAFWVAGSNHIVEGGMYADVAVAERHGGGAGVVTKNGVFVAATNASTRSTTYAYSPYDVGGPNFIIGNRFYNYRGTHGAITGRDPYTRQAWDVYAESLFVNSTNVYNPNIATTARGQVVVRDTDGSLTGHCNAWIVPTMSPPLLTSDCYLTSGGYGYACSNSPPRRRIAFSPVLASGYQDFLPNLNVIRTDNGAYENKSIVLGTYQIQIVSSGTYWLSIPGGPSPTDNLITTHTMPSGLDDISGTSPEYVRVVWNYPAGSTFAIIDFPYQSQTTVNFTQVYSKSALVARTYFFDSANEWLYIHIQATVIQDTYLFVQNFSQITTAHSIRVHANCPGGNCTAREPNKSPTADPAPVVGRKYISCGYKPLLTFTPTGASTLSVLDKGVLNPILRISGTSYSRWVLDPYGSGEQVFMANFTNNYNQVFGTIYNNVSISSYTHLHFKMALKGAGQRGIQVSINLGTCCSSSRISTINPWQYANGQGTPSDDSRWVDVYMPLSRFDGITFSTPLTYLIFWTDGPANYMVYLKDVYFGNFRVTNAAQMA